MTALAHQLRRLSDDGHIDTEDPERAATHLLLLTTSEIRDHDRLPRAIVCARLSSGAMWRTRVCAVMSTFLHAARR